MRLVDADALIQKHGMDVTNWDNPCAVYISSIENAPTVDAVPVVHGRWEQAEYKGFVRCDQCKDVYINEEWLMDGKWNNCPNCGAKMDGDGNG